MAHFQIYGGSLSANLFLLVFKKLGMPTTLFDSDEPSWPALIFLPPNAQKIIKWLGLELQVSKNAIQINRHDLVNSHGQPLRVMGPGFYTDPSGLNIQAIPGNIFQQIIKQEIDSLLPVYQRTSDHEEIWLNIETRPWAIEPLLSKTGIKYTGYWLLEGFADFNLPLTMATSLTDVWTRNGRIRVCPIENGRIFWQARIPHPGGLPAPDQPINWLKNQFKDTSGIITDIVEAIKRIDNSYNENVKWSNTVFHQDVILAGSAKVQLSGESLQAQAIYFEEAFQMTHYLAKSADWMGALEQYQKKCMSKTRLIYQDDWWTGQLHRSTSGRVILQLLLKMLPEKALKQQLNLLYRVNGLDGGNY